MLSVDKLECTANNELINASPSLRLGHIWNCLKMKDCKNQKAGGLHHHIYSLFSCHFCKDDNKIPFVPIKGGGTSYVTIEGINEYDLNVVLNERYDAKFGGYSTFCAEPTNTSFNIASNVF